MPRTSDPETRGHELAEELNTTLNEEFKDTVSYRTAVEEVLSFFESVIAGLDADAPDDDDFEDEV